MKPITCMITDDEPMARKGLQGYVLKVPFLQLQGVCEDALQLNSLLQQQTVDLLFLDIEMPYLLGIELLRSLKEPPKVILTTAYENYALQGYELDVLDYLLKPISFERFMKAANKAADYFASRQAPAPDYAFFKVDGRLEKVVFSEVLFAEAMENYVALYTGTRKLITHATLKSVQAVLPPHFVQPHKSYLVNPAFVTAVEGGQLHVSGYRVPLSKYQKDEVLQRLLGK
jgi:DNA-binding LytR/AlgR family response regulator